jgi:hypothetical protein
LRTGMTDGSLISGEILARWQEYLAEGEFVRRLDGGAPNLSDRVSTAVRRDQEVIGPLEVPVAEGIADTIRAAIRTATDEVLDHWRQFPFGPALLTSLGQQVTATDVDTRLERAVRDWRVEVSTRITTVARTVSGIDPGTQVDGQAAADVIFMALVDDRSEPDVDSPVTASLGAARRIVEGFLGAETVGLLVAEARADLLSCAVTVLQSERRRLERLLESDESVAGRSQALRVAIGFVDSAG